jgi:hypothetical protein
MKARARATGTSDWQRGHGDRGCLGRHDTGVSDPDLHYRYRLWLERLLAETPALVEEVVTLFAPAGDDGDDATEAVFAASLIPRTASRPAILSIEPLRRTRPARVSPLRSYARGSGRGGAR